MPPPCAVCSDVPNWDRLLRGDRAKGGDMILLSKTMFATRLALLALGLGLAGGTASASPIAAGTDTAWHRLRRRCGLFGRNRGTVRLPFRRGLSGLPAGRIGTQRPRLFQSRWRARGPDRMGFESGALFRRLRVWTGERETFWRGRQRLFACFHFFPPPRSSAPVTRTISE